MSAAQPSISIAELLILAVAVGFLVYAFTGSSRVVATVLFCGLLLLLGAGLLGLVHRGGPDRRLLELGKQSGRRAAQTSERKSDAPLSDVTLFDITSQGQDFVFVIDVSASMGDGGDRSPLAGLKTQLKRGLNAMKPGSRFQIIAYDHEPELLITPRAANVSIQQGLVPANTRAIHAAFQQIDKLTASGGAEPAASWRHSRALNLALDSRPNSIYLLTDGQDAPLTSKELSLLRRWNRWNTAIHVVQLQRDSAAPRAEWLAQLAQENAGSFQLVEVKASTKPAEVTTEVARSGTPSNNASDKANLDWVTKKYPPIRSAAPSGKYETAVHAAPKSSDARARAALDEAVQKTVAEYVDQVVESGAGARLTEQDAVWNHVRSQIVKQTHAEVIDDEDPVIGRMWHMHALLTFTEQDANYFRRAWRETVQEKRLWSLAGVVGLVLAFLGTIFGYLKMDTATRGYYSGRLKFAAGVVTILLAVLAVALANAMHWFGG
jgi:hypothetical protein